jgi:hypothetical protein
MTDWRPIEFEDIRKGDRIKAHKPGVDHIGVVDHSRPRDDYDPARWFSAQGDYITKDESAYENYLDPDSRPKEPEVPTGTAGTAMVRGVEGVRVFRAGDEGFWFSVSRVEYTFAHPDNAVSDFKPDVLWEDVCKKLVEQFLDGGRLISADIVRRFVPEEH